MPTMLLFQKLCPLMHSAVHSDYWGALIFSVYSWGFNFSKMRLSATTKKKFSNGAQIMLYDD